MFGKKIVIVVSFTQEQLPATALEPLMQRTDNPRITHQHTVPGGFEFTFVFPARSAEKAEEFIREVEQRGATVNESNGFQAVLLDR